MGRLLTKLQAKKSLTKYLKNKYALGGERESTVNPINKINKGDNLSTIASNNNMSLSTLLDMNPKFKDNPNMINVGDSYSLTMDNVMNSIARFNSPTTLTESQAIKSPSLTTFNDAFSYYRKTLGSNRIFEFEGRKYGTNIAGEEFNPSIEEIAKNKLPVNSTIDRLKEQNKKVKSPITDKDTVKLEPEFKDWEKIKKDKEDINRMNQIDVIKNYYNKSKKQGNFIVVDKKKGLVHVYNSNRTEPLYTSTIDVGENEGDAQTVTKIDRDKADKNKDGILSKQEASVAKADFSKGNKSTGAGRYKITNIDSKGYGGKPLLNLMNESGNEVATSFHKGFIDDGNSKVSNGCIRCKPKTLDYLYKNMKKGQEVYILPEDDGNQFVYENGKLNFRSDNDKDYDSYTDSNNVKRKGQGINRTKETLNYKPVRIQIDEQKFKKDKFTYLDFNDEKEYNTVVKPFIKSLETSKQKVMKIAKINGDVYNDIMKVAFGILGTESEFGDTHSAIGNFGRAVTKYFNKDSSSPDYKSKENYREISGKKQENISTGLTQIRWSETDEDDRKILEEAGITSSLDFMEPEKAALGTVLLLSNRYKYQLNSKEKKDILSNLPKTWNKRSNYSDRVKQASQYINIQELN